MTARYRWKRSNNGEDKTQNGVRRADGTPPSRVYSLGTRARNISRGRRYVRTSRVRCYLFSSRTPPNYSTRINNYWR